MLDQIPLLPPNIEHSNEQHREILEAIISRNPTLASELMRTHLEGSAALLRGFLS
jgi:DNA-binding FadR family transcriptional regulator